MSCVVWVCTDLKHVTRTDTTDTNSLITHHSLHHYIPSMSKPLKCTWNGCWRVCNCHVVTYFLLKRGKKTVWLRMWYGLAIRKLLRNHMPQHVSCLLSPRPWLLQTVNVCQGAIRSLLLIALFVMSCLILADKREQPEERQLGWI